MLGVSVTVGAVGTLVVQSQLQKVRARRAARAANLKGATLAGMNLKGATLEGGTKPPTPGGPPKGGRISKRERLSGEEAVADLSALRETLAQGVEIEGTPALLERLELLGVSLDAALPETDPPSEPGEMSGTEALTALMGFQEILGAGHTVHGTPPVLQRFDLMLGGFTQALHPRALQRPPAAPTKRPASGGKAGTLAPSSPSTKISEGPPESAPEGASTEEKLG